MGTETTGEDVAGHLPQQIEFLCDCAPKVSQKGAELPQQVHFCTTLDGTKIAYSALGVGPPLVKAAHWLTHLEYDLESPVFRHTVRELSRDNSYIRYDERGCGLSDWDIPNYSFETWVSDLETVVDDLGLRQFSLLGSSQGGPVAIAYSVRHPERVSKLILYGTFAQGWNKRNLRPEEVEEMEARITLTKSGWGRDNASYRQIFTSDFIPDGTLEQIKWFNDLQRITTSPENAVRFLKEFSNIDVLKLLPDVSVPTLILHARHDAVISFERGRQLAASIPNARFVPIEGKNHFLLEEEPGWTHFLHEIRNFLGVSEVISPETTSKDKELGISGWLKGPKKKGAT